MQFESLKKLFHTIESALRPHPGFYSSKQKTKSWLDKMNIENYKINDDLSVDVNGSVQIGNKGISYLPVQFGKVNGWFACSSNPLRSLKGAPSHVTGYLLIDATQITNLDYCPQYVGEHINASKCPLLTSLKGCPESLQSGILLNDCALNSLEYVAQNIKGNLDLTNNNVSNFKYAPQNVNGIFATNNPISSLKDLIGKNFEYLSFGIENITLNKMAEWEITDKLTNPFNNEKVYQIDGEKFQRFHKKERLSHLLEEKREPISKKLKI